MPGGVAEINRDDTPFATGTHKGSTHATILNDPGADFRSCGVQTAVLIKNTTDGSSGQITARDENTVTATLTGGTNNSWTAGDTYEIYRTATEDSIISTIWTDRSRGWKSDKDELVKGWRKEDLDIDRENPHVWSPGFPERH